MIDLSHRHVFIAGGSRGIGAATARMAARAGARVSVNFRTHSDEAEALVSAIRSDGGQAVTVQADVSEDGAVRAAMEAAVAVLGPLTGLVVSAGIFEAGCSR